MIRYYKQKSLSQVYTIDQHIRPTNDILINVLIFFCLGDTTGGAHLILALCSEMVLSLGLYEMPGTEPGSVQGLLHTKQTPYHCDITLAPLIIKIV